MLWIWTLLPLYIIQGVLFLVTCDSLQLNLARFLFKRHVRDGKCWKCSSTCLEVETCYCNYKPDIHNSHGLHHVQNLHHHGLQSKFFLRVYTWIDRPNIIFYCLNTYMCISCLFCLDSLLTLRLRKLRATKFGARMAVKKQRISFQVRSQLSFSFWNH